MNYNTTEINYLKSRVLELDAENIHLPIEIINHILCYTIDGNNYMDLLLLSKDIYNYFKKYVKKVLLSYGLYDKIISSVYIVEQTYNKTIYESVGFGSRLVDTINEYGIDVPGTKLYGPHTLIKNIKFIIEDKYTNLKLDDNRDEWCDVMNYRRSFPDGKYDFDHFYIMIRNDCYSTACYLTKMNMEDTIDGFDCI